MEPCKQETSVALIQSSMDDIKVNIAKILLILEGNGGDGLTTRVALNKQSIKRVWWWVGAVSIAILGIAVYVIRTGMS